jgi:hypothetical protein
MRPEGPARAEAGLAGRVLAAQLLDAGLRVRVRVHGASMRPALRDGDRVELEPLRGPPRRGEVVMARRDDGGVLLHRVVRAFGDGRIQTRGDANWRLDDPLCHRQVLGRVSRMHRGGARWQSAPRRPWALTLSVWLLARSFVAYRIALLRCAG